MALTIRTFHLADPDGHKPALLLKGDWLMVEISDGSYRGYGEASHSCDDGECGRLVRVLFDRYCTGLNIDMAGIRRLEEGGFARADGFVEATAMSALNQALYDLLARRSGVPVWRLFVDEPVCRSVPAYATINRALNERTVDDYCATAMAALEQGFTAIKCAPFEAVVKEGDQVEQARVGFARLSALRRRMPEFGIRVDCHERFRLDALHGLLPEFESFAPDWLEAPVPIGSDYGKVRQLTDLPIALGELFFGWQRFHEIVANDWADVIMPDVKHCGGFGPLVDICRRTPASHTVSPHNPAGPVATAASLHAAAVCPAVTSLEMVLIGDPERAYYLDALKGGRLHLPTGPGWGDAVSSFIEKSRS